jgi:hypothetical protein
LLSHFAFTFNIRRYSKGGQLEEVMDAEEKEKEEAEDEEGDKDGDKARGLLRTSTPDRRYIAASSASPTSSSSFFSSSSLSSFSARL